MDQAKPSETAMTSNGSERRAHTRYPISIPVDIMIEGIGMRSAQARDFCLGGLLIVFSPEHALPVNENIDQCLCLITLKIDGDDFRMRARIVRGDLESIGVSFINPDQIAIQALQHHAKADAQPVESQTSATQTTTKKSDQATTQQNVGTEKRSQILNDCNDKIRAIVDPLLRKFFTVVNESLLEQARQTDELALQNSMFKALETINNNKSLFSSTFNNSINTALNDNGTAVNDSHSPVEDTSAGSLELISDEEFNVWLANSKVINKVESEYPQLLGEIERRLTYLYNTMIDRRNNPYGPVLFVNSFQGMLELLEIDNLSKTYCYDAFRTSLVSILEKLYQDINQILIQNNILPNLKDILAQTKKESSSTDSTAAETVQEQTTKDDGQDKQIEINDGSIPIDTDKKQILSNDDKIQNGKSTEQYSQHSVYELVGEIRNLQKQLKHTDRSHSNIPGSTADHIEAGQIERLPNRPAYSTAEVLDIVGNIVSPVKNAKGDGQSIAAFREMLGEKLSNESASPDSKTLSLQQERVIDVTENVFNSLLNDLQVAQSIRPWLEQLAIPVMKMALLDENIFTDKNHVVRNVINKLAELEVLASAQDEEEQAAVRQAFNWVINLVNKEFDGTTKVYTRAAQQLDLLINVQQQSFEKNIKQVVAEVIKEEQDKTSERELTSDDDLKEDKWLRMVRRLKEEHWVLFDADREDSKRLKVAWIAPRKGKYVFVNVMGRKDRITTDEKLAEEFKSGTAVVLDGTDDPAMDRAQYGMLQKLHKQLLYQSTHDELTGLINRREFLNCIQHALEDSKSDKNKHVIFYIDIDNFKVVNNNYGYEAGDKLLNEIVAMFTKNIQTENVLSRIGADQFGLLLQKTSMDDAVEFFEEIMDQYLDYRFEWQENRMAVTLSAGIAVINASSDSATNILQSAESSCSIAKEAGGNQIQIAHSGSHRLSRRKKDMEWASKIDKTLDEDGLFLRCQKIMPVQQHLDQRPHYEILLGISDELGGNQALGNFIQAAEHHNRMPAIDRWVIQNSFDWLAHHEDMVSDISTFTINLSGQSLNNEELIDFIYQEVSRSSVPIENICFEVTETAGVTNLSDTADFIETIKGTGCKFALDDFGTGMSSYSYLKSLPVDYLKIDGTFIKDIINNRNDYAVVKSICEIGHFMEKRVIAEFVQDEQSSKLLKEIGIDFLQGYGIEKPHKLDELIR